MRYVKLVKKIAYVFIFICSNAYAVSEHTGIWTGFVVVGPARFGPDIKYYADGQLKLIDDPYKFDEVYASVGLGKQINERWLLFIANRLSASKQLSNGQMNYEYRLWQEANWRKNFWIKYDVSTRSRLEERKRFSAAEIALRLRERLMVRTPITWWQGHTFVVYNEMFFNLNNPSWVLNTFVDQNRFFIGFGSMVNKKVEVDIGYMNKYAFSSPRQMTNILAINFNITGKSHYYKE